MASFFQAMKLSSGASLRNNFIHIQDIPTNIETISERVIDSEDVQVIQRQSSSKSLVSSLYPSPKKLVNKPVTPPESLDNLANIVKSERAKTGDSIKNRTNSILDQELLSEKDHTVKETGSIKSDHLSHDIDDDSTKNKESIEETQNDESKQKDCSLSEDETDRKSSSYEPQTEKEKVTPDSYEEKETPHKLHEQKQDSFEHQNEETLSSEPQEGTKDSFENKEVEENLQSSNDQVEDMVRKTSIDDQMEEPDKSDSQNVNDKTDKNIKNTDDNLSNSSTVEITDNSPQNKSDITEDSENVNGENKIGKFTPLPGIGNSSTYSHVNTGILNLYF